MKGIYEPNASFPFDKTSILSPTALSGGNYFLKMLVNQAPLYIQMPKSKTKEGIMQTGKRCYCDLLFTNADDALIRWMEDLERFACQYIYDHREKWFETEMELTDIENYFASPLKTFRSGKFYLARANIPQRLGKINLKIFNEAHESVETEKLTDKTDIISIIEIQGIKCSARSFQIEMEVKQMMTLETKDLFETCIFNAQPETSESLAKARTISIPAAAKNGLIIDNVVIRPDPDQSTLDKILAEPTIENTVNLNEPALESSDETGPSQDETDQIDLGDFEVDVMDGLVADGGEVVHLKSRNDVYYELYREARKKAQIAKKMAFEAYLEANKIKNTYQLEIDDDESSDEEWMDQSDESEI